MSRQPPRLLVVGVGNPDRGDDAAGLLVARKLRETLPEKVEVVEHRGEAASLVELLGRVTTAILVDACVSGTASGTVHRFDAAATPLPSARFGASTHALGLAEAIELARALGDLPPQCIVYAVEAASFEAGAAPSFGVMRGVAEAARRIAAEIAPPAASSADADVQRSGERPPMLRRH